MIARAAAAAAAAADGSEPAVAAFRFVPVVGARTRAVSVGVVALVFVVVTAVAMVASVVVMSIALVPLVPLVASALTISGRGGGGSVAPGVEVADGAAVVFEAAVTEENSGEERRARLEQARGRGERTVGVEEARPHLHDPVRRSARVVFRIAGILRVKPAFGAAAHRARFVSKKKKKKRGTRAREQRVERTSTERSQGCSADPQPRRACHERHVRVRRVLRTTAFVRQGTQRTRRVASRTTIAVGGVGGWGEGG